MFNVAQSRKFVEKELTKFQKLNYNQFRWWRWYESRNKPLPNKADFRDKIFNGDFDAISIFLGGSLKWYFLEEILFPINFLHLMLEIKTFYFEYKN